jgi:hypothetical protein
MTVYSIFCDHLQSFIDAVIISEVLLTNIAQAIFVSSVYQNLVAFTYRAV